MPRRRLVAVTLGLVLVLSTAGCAGTVPGLAEPDPAFERSGLDSLRTSGPTCGTPRSTNTSSYSRPVPGGRKLSINATIPVRSRGTELEASFEEIAPHRFRLDVERVGGSGTPDCSLETRYNATVNLTDAVTDRYTLLVTYDGVLAAVYYADEDGSGAGHGLAPAARYAPWTRNVTDGRDGAASSGGDAGGVDASGSGTGSAGG